MSNSKTPTTPKKRTGRPTLRDVAGRAGVSVAAASKVLRDAYGVSPAMRERVNRAIEELAYRPLAAARGLRGRSFTIGVMLSDIENPFFSQITQGLRDELGESDYEFFLGPAGTTAEKHREMLNAMVDRQVDGIVAIAPLLDGDALEELGAELPLVVIGRHGPSRNFDTVSGDDELGSALVVAHLTDLAHQRIAMVTFAHGNHADQRLPQEARTSGYVRAMRLRGLSNRVDILPATWSYEGGAAAGLALLQRSELPTAVYGGADVAALGLLNALEQAGVKVPGDVSVVGYDNSTISAYPQIGLTSVDQFGTALGATASRFLIERIDGRTDSLTYVAEPRLIARRTTGRARD